MVGTIPPCSILWIAAAETSERSASCCSERPMLLRRVNTLSPIEPTMRSRLSAAFSACGADCASRHGGAWVRGSRVMVPFPPGGSFDLDVHNVTASIVYEVSRILNGSFPYSSEEGTRGAADRGDRRGRGGHRSRRRGQSHRSGGRRQIGRAHV